MWFIYAYIFESIISLAILFYSKHLEKSFKWFALTLTFVAVETYFILSNCEIWIKIAINALNALLFAAFAFFLSKTNYDFNSKIFGFKWLFNSIFKPKIRGHIIGRVLPYNLYQFKYNGRWLTKSETAMVGGTLVSGSTGSGKTYHLMQCVKQDMLQGRSVVFCEYKGDADLIKELVDFAKTYDYPIFTIKDGLSNFNYDPLLNLSNIGRKEAIINMRKWSLDGVDDHYRTGLQILLQRLLGEYEHVWNHREKNGEYESYTLSFYKWMKSYSYSSDEKDAYFTALKLLELLVESSLNSMFAGKNGKTLNFRDLRDQKFIMIVSFVSANKELATSFTSLMLNDLLNECTLHPNAFPICLYADEFATLVNPYLVKDALEKGRAGNLAATLSLQDINQIIIQTNEAYLNSILGTINNFVIFNGATRVTAEKFAGVQLFEIEPVLMNLRKPINGSPTAIYISKFPTLNKRINSEVFRFEPYVEKIKLESKMESKQQNAKIEHSENALTNGNDKNGVQNPAMESNMHNSEIKPVNYEDLI